MKKLINRAKYVLNGEEGASNVEIIVWFSVVFVIATILFLFRDSVTSFITDIAGNIDNLDRGHGIDRGHGMPNHGAPK